MNTYTVDRPGWWRRLNRWILPPVHHAPSELSTGFADVIYTDVKIHFAPRDRLRLLFTGRAEVRVVTQCEYKPGVVKTRSSVSTT